MNLNNIGAEGQYAIGAIFGGAFCPVRTGNRRTSGTVDSGTLLFHGRSSLGIVCAVPKGILERQ